MRLKSARVGRDRRRVVVRVVYGQSGGRELERVAGLRGVLSSPEVALLVGVPKIRIQRMMARGELGTVKRKGARFILCCHALRAKRALARATSRS